jgi:hypothetical protein
LLPHKDITVDEENEFLKIGQIWDDHDLILGYRKQQNGIWARSERSDTNMVDLFYDADEDLYVVCYKVNFFDYTPGVEKFSIDNIHEAILDIKKWIKNM